MALTGSVFFCSRFINTFLEIFTGFEVRDKLAGFMYTHLPCTRVSNRSGFAVVVSERAKASDFDAAAICQTV